MSHPEAAGGRDGTPSAGAGRVGVSRVDRSLGLAIDRVGRSERTLVTYARDHVTVRTPSRPDFRDGNTLDLLAPPSPGDLQRWVDRFADTIGSLGVRHVQVRWEERLAPDAPAAPPVVDPALAAAWRRLGFDLGADTVLLLDRLLAPDRPSPAELVPVEPPSAVPGGAVDRRWHAAAVLYRYADGSGPKDWRTYDEPFTAWSVDVQREMAGGGRAQVWLAVRYGTPVGRCTVFHDRQGLASVEDVIVHPVHRGLGIASALTHRAISSHLERSAGSRVGLGAEPGSRADRLYRRLGFRPHATVWTAVRR